MRRMNVKTVGGWDHYLTTTDCSKIKYHLYFTGFVGSFCNKIFCWIGKWKKMVALKCYYDIEVTSSPEVRGAKVTLPSVPTPVQYFTGFCRELLLVQDYFQFVGQGSGKKRNGSSDIEVTSLPEVRGAKVTLDSRNCNEKKIPVQCQDQQDRVAKTVSLNKLTIMCQTKT